MDPLRDLRDVAPDLSAERLSRCREAFMFEITRVPEDVVASGAAPRRRWPRRRKLAIGAIALSALGIGAIAVAAHTSAVFRQDNGAYAVGDVQPVYHGAVVTPEQLKELNAHGKARFGSSTMELACQGVALYFDTDAEQDQYIAEYNTREARRWAAWKTAGGPPQGDPCPAYADAPAAIAHTP